MQLVSNRAFYFRVWWPAFLIAQFVALVIVGSLEPEGFDRCTAMPSPTAQTVQAAIAGIAVVGVVLLAVWRLRCWLLVAALVPAGLAAFVWWVLLGSSRNC